VVIPAHNEGMVIGRLLAGLLADAKSDEFDVVVVANGCTDDTAVVSAGFGAAVTVLTTPTPSKAAALRLGDRHARGFPRLYVDADVELGTADARALADALTEPGVLAVAPHRELVLDRRPLAVRWYYEFWQRLPVVRAGLFGRGVIGVDAAGWQRLRDGPEVMGDDLAASMAFAAGARRVVAHSTVRVHAPRTRADLIRRRIRSVTATAQVRHLAGPAAAGGDAGGTSRADLLRVLRREPRMVLRLPVFIGITAVSRAAARRRIRAGDFQTWLRDESSRRPAPGDPA
jgi:glycosyltransferase involved in cell wall biosynthesis